MTILKAKLRGTLHYSEFRSGLAAGEPVQVAWNPDLEMEEPIDQLPMSGAELTILYDHVRPASDYSDEGRLLAERLGGCDCLDQSIGYLTSFDNPVDPKRVENAAQAIGVLVEVCGAHNVLRLVLSIEGFYTDG